MQKIKKIIPLLLTICILFTACGKGKPEDTVKSFLDASKANDDKKMESLVVDFDKDTNVTESEEEENELLNTFYQKKAAKLSYSIENSKVEDNKATVTVKCRYINLKPFVEKMMKDYLAEAFAASFSGDENDVDEEKIIKEIYEKNKKDYKDEFVEKTIDVKCELKDDVWKISKLSTELKDAISCNMYSYYKDIEDSFSEEGSEKDSEEDSEKTPDSKLGNIDYWVSEDIWSNGLCDISWYVSEGTDSCGDTMDVKVTINKLKKNMKKKSEYNDFINGLKDEKYKDIKVYWNKLSPEMDKLYNKVVEKEPKAKDSSYTFDTGLFEQYMEAFSDEVENLK